MFFTDHSPTWPDPDPTGPDDPAANQIDPAFVFDFHALDDLERSDQRWSTWLAVEPLCRGPEPHPDWLVTSQGAIDTELGILKSGKEADVFLVERAEPGSSGVVMAAKRYRDDRHRSFHRSAAYTEGRRVRNTRDARAMRKKTSHGRAVAAGQWAWAEWTALNQLWRLGLPVPYPVQLDGTELLMEWIEVEGETAPRLAQVRPDERLLRSYFDQVRGALGTLTGAGLVHGDLSAYNMLAHGERVVIIDLPQVVELASNPAGLDFLQRDCHNVTKWFCARGLDVDEHELFAEMVTQAF